VPATAGFRESIFCVWGMFIILANSPVLFGVLLEVRFEVPSERVMPVEFLGKYADSEAVKCVAGEYQKKCQEKRELILAFYSDFTFSLD